MVQSERQSLTSIENGSRIGVSSIASRFALRRLDPALLAWALILGAFAVFCTLAVATPLAVTHYLQVAVRENRAVLATVSGTTQLLERGQPRWLAVSGSERVAQGGSLQTDGASRSIVEVYEGSSDYVLATIHVFGDTQMSLVQATNPRFSTSRHPNRVTVQLRQGRLRLNPGPPGERELVLKVAVPEGEVTIEDGSVALEVTADATEIAVRTGRAVLTALATGEQLVLEGGERAVLAGGGAVKGPLPVGRNLVSNGDFGAGLALSWESYNEQGGDAGAVDGQVLLLEGDGSRVVRFQRTGGQQDHCETGIRQYLRRDVTDYLSLRIGLDLRLLQQSLSGGGFQGSEFPLMLRLYYRDARGNLQFYTWGFYYENPAAYPTPLADMIEREVWFVYESPDLMATLGDNKPVYLESIQVYASGHDYVSEVRDVQIVAE